ncbi:hypothetical protein MSG28_009047, partial [Choristoneura fumiferana]
KHKGLVSPRRPAALSLPPALPAPATTPPRGRGAASDCVSALPQYAFITLREYTVTLLVTTKLVRDRLDRQCCVIIGLFSHVSMATESGDMRSLGSLLGWEADDPGDNVILSRLTRLISAHLPDGWQEWRVHTYSKEDLLGNELDPQVLNKVRFAIPTTGLARAFSPNCSSLSERAYRDIKLKLLEWPLCVGLIIGPASLAARIRGSAVQNELVVAALADIKPLLICREEANRELSADTEDNGSVTHSSRRSNSSVRVSKRQDRLSRLEENHMVLKEMLESFMKKFETPFDSQENSACESTDEDSASAYSSENNGPPVTEKSSTQATSAWKPPEPPLGSDDDFDWQPCTKPQDPVIPNPKPLIAEQGVKVLRLGDTTYNQIRYVEVQKRLHAAPVFGTLKANPVLVKHITPNPVQDQLGKMDYVLGTVVHGLLMQRDSLHGALKDLSNKHPGLKEDLKSHLSTGSAMKTISDDLLQFACGRRNEIIEQRRNLLIPKDEYQASLLNSVPPSTTHLFCETKLAEVLKQPPQQIFFRSNKPRRTEGKRYISASGFSQGKVSKKKAVNKLRSRHSDKTGQSSRRPTQPISSSARGRSSKGHASRKYKST